MAVGDPIYGDKISTTVLVEEEKVETGPHKGKWKRELRFCNITDQPLTVLITDNPWKISSNPNPWANKLYKGTKDANGKYSKESGTKEAKKNGKKYTLSAKAAGNNCVRITYYYPWKPTGKYTDLYEAAPGGAAQSKPAEGTSSAGPSYPLLIGMLPESPRVSHAAVIPFPYPVSVESETAGPVDAVLDRVEGLPEEFELIGTLPPLGEPHRLDPGDRMSSAVVYFRQNAPMRAERVSVAAFQKIVGPEEVADWPERRLDFELKKSDTPLTAPEHQLEAELATDLAGIEVRDSFDEEPSVEPDDPPGVPTWALALAGLVLVLLLAFFLLR